MVCVILNKNFSSNSIFFLKIKPSPLFHSIVTGLFGVSVLFPLTFQIVSPSGNFIFSFPPDAQPVSIKYSSEEFFGFKKITLFSPFKVSL